MSLEKENSISDLQENIYTPAEEKNIALLATNDADLESREIPAIDLYLDQIISLISNKNLSASECYSDRNLTKMMVNNYAKGGLIDPPIGKKYSKTHIIQMLLVNRLKSGLSMSEIKQLLDNMKDEGTDLVSLYDDFTDKKEALHKKASSIIEEKTNEYGEDARAVLSLLALSDYFKNAAKLIIDKNYPVKEEEAKKSEQKKNEQKKKSEA